MRMRMVVMLAAGCGGPAADQHQGTELDTSVCAATGTLSADVDNRFFPLRVGEKRTYVEPGGFRVVITVLAETEVVAGVTTRVVHEYETEDGELVEQSWNYFAQAADGTVCYFGEKVDIYEGGVIVAHDGQWRADQAGFAPGIQMPADPMPGTYHVQEVAPDVAEDYANIVARGGAITVPHGTFTDTLRTEEWTPLEPGELSPKAYAAGIGMIDDNGAVLTAVEAQ